MMIVKAGCLLNTHLYHFLDNKRSAVGVEKRREKQKERRGKEEESEKGKKREEKRKEVKK